MDRIGRYRLGQRLGAGSFATVYQAHDDQLDVPVAVKVLAENWAANEDVRSRFLAEARLMRRIGDERVVKVYDIGTSEDGRPYFVMDYANAGSLDDLRRRPVEPGLALRLCAEGARALEVLHRHAVIHRDVTPGNILLNVTPDGATHVLLADLGVAKSMVGQAGATMTAGTPAYMALEQATGVGTLDQRADIYSMAAVTYALLAGRPPFPVKTLADLLARNPQVGPAPIASQIGAPPQLDQLLAAALSPDPAQRPPTAAILADALDALADVMPGGNAYVPRPLPPADGTVLRSASSASGLASASLPSASLPSASGVSGLSAPSAGSLIGSLPPGSLPPGSLPPAAPAPTGMAPLPGSWGAQQQWAPQAPAPTLQAAAAGPVADTPTRFTDRYLGRTATAAAPATQSSLRWVWLGVAALVVFTVALLLTLWLAG